MTYDEITAKVAESHELSKSFVDKVYRAYWKAVRMHIASLPLKDDLTEDEFNKLRVNVNIPSLGKLYVTYDRYRKMKEIYNKFKNRKIEDATRD